MIWALLAFIGIPIWFIVVILISVFRHRKRVRTSPSVFEYKLRTDKGWSRAKSFGEWVSDVLISYSGMALVKTEVRQVFDIERQGSVDPVPKGMPDETDELVLGLQGKESVRIAIARADSAKALGPFGRP